MSNSHETRGERVRRVPLGCWQPAAGLSGNGSFFCFGLVPLCVPCFPISENTVAPIYRHVHMPVSVLSVVSSLGSPCSLGHLCPQDTLSNHFCFITRH